MTNVHPAAIIHARASLGEDVEVGPYTTIGPDVVVGDRTRIGSHVCIQGPTTIGGDCQVYFSAAVGFPPQDLKYRGEEAKLVVGDSNVIREFTTLNRGTAASGTTLIGDNNLLMAYVHVAHDCVIGNGNIIANGVQLAGHVVIEDYVCIGGLVPVHQFVRIGSYAFIGGGCRVAQDVPPYFKAAGDPLRLYGLNSVGLRRRNFDAESTAILKKAYRLLCRSDLNTAQALQLMATDLPQTEEIRHLVDFARATKRGIVK
jgi:UDP-N-acetylglucosamine acyltransferase